MIVDQFGRAAAGTGGHDACGQILGVGIVLADQAQPVDEAAEPDCCHDDAEHVDRSRRGLPDVAQPGQTGGADQGSDRQHETEHPAPGEVLGEHPTQQQPDGAAGGGDSHRVEPGTDEEPADRRRPAGHGRASRPLGVPGGQPGPEHLQVHGGRRGDLFVRVQVEVPKKLSERQEELIRELAEMLAPEETNRPSDDAGRGAAAVQRTFSDIVSDDEAARMAREIARRIENEMTYPGQVKVTVIRETRITDIARN